MQKKTINKTFTNVGSKNAKRSSSYLKQLYRRSKLFRWQLKPPFKTAINKFMPPHDPWRGSAKIGGDILHSNLPIGTFQIISHLNGFAMLEILVGTKPEFLHVKKYHYG